MTPILFVGRSFLLSTLASKRELKVVARARALVEVEEGLLNVVESFIIQLWKIFNANEVFSLGYHQNIASGTSTTPIVKRIDKLERQIIDGKLTLVDDDRNSLPKLFSMASVVSYKVDDLVNEDNDNEIEEVNDEIATYMAYTSFNVNKASKSSSGGGSKRLCEEWKENHGEDSYNDDDFDDPGLIDAQMKFANAFDINLRGQLR
ncbi:hypothetical protein Tco_0774036 [Tanacetum coccineum]|uniref:Uncharacterized protein n=1 Tax=Tanacetum coccineum TaxID=301880 RepID=A0ABQ4ZNB1_9ASTR